MSGCEESADKKEDGTHYVFCKDCRAHAKSNKLQRDKYARYRNEE